MTRPFPWALLACLAGCAPGPAPAPPEPWTNLLPRAQSVTVTDGVFTLGADARLSADPALEPVAELLASTLRASTGFALPVGESGAIRLQLAPELSALGAEGYELSVEASRVIIRAPEAAGVFYGAQTFLQLLPARVERTAAQPGPWRVATGTIRDQPRFAWRGLMLDVARHFFTPAEVRRYVDVIARYKLNRLHLHLTDDQGWRIHVDAWPALTTVGAATEVGGGAGGFYTKAEYAELVQYAAARFVTVVPEIDLPGHTHAALASVPELNCDGVAPAPYTGVSVGFSSLCAGRPVTAQFIGDVIGEIAALTPGPFLHVGGDEAKMTSDADYGAMMAVVRDAVRANGKQLLAWEELARADAGAGEIVQHWLDPTLASAAAARGAKVVLSPARRAYLDMQYDLDVPAGTGTFWAGFVNVPAAYDWDPGALLDGVPESAVLGVEAAAWTETIATTDQLDLMVFPRALGMAELGWSQPGSVRSYLERLGAHGPRLEARGIGFFAAPQVRWGQ